MLPFDSHAHVQDSAFDEDRAAVLNRASHGLSGIVGASDSLETSRAAIAVTGGRVWATAGIHPYLAESVDDSALEALASLAAAPAVVAIGEIGLDYYNEFAPRDAQARAFRRQLELAARLELPVAVHCREAHDDALPILEEYRRRLPGIVMHCFGGGPSEAKRYLDMGCFISFAGNLTFPKAQELRDAAKAVPLEHLLVETDCPYLAPQVRRGKRCEPAFAAYTAECLAVLKNVTPEEMAEATARNAARIFGLAL